MTRRLAILLTVLAGVVVLAFRNDGAGDVGGPGAKPVPAPTAEPVIASPGCKVPDAGRRRARRVVSPPARPVPFFAARTGALPADGPATVGGVALPRGSRCRNHWATDEPVRDPFGLASRLAAEFPRTGLWPVVWDVSWDDPDSYVSTGNPAAADRLDAETVLRRTWPGRGPFPGLAVGASGTGEIADPFGPIENRVSPDWQPAPELVLLLVPANRPADVATVFGPQSEVISDNAVTAVLRSWEERFGAVLIVVAPGGLGLSVDAAPRDPEQAHRLAAEQVAFAPEDQLPGGWRRLAELLRAGAPGDDAASRDVWYFGWPD